MKARIQEVPVEKNKFKPFVLEIDVDTKESLMVLWHLFNLSQEAFDGARSDGNGNSHDVPSTETWKLLDEKVYEYELSGKL